MPIMLTGKHMEVFDLGMSLLEKYDKTGDWTFDFDRAKRRLGYCDYKKKVISLSIHYITSHGIEVARDTILHEIAHILAGPRHGHDTFWKQKCIEIGAKPQTCAQLFDESPLDHKEKCIEIYGALASMLTKGLINESMTVGYLMQNLKELITTKRSF